MQFYDFFFLGNSKMLLTTKKVMVRVQPNNNHTHYRTDSTNWVAPTVEQTLHEGAQTAHKPLTKNSVK